MNRLTSWAMSALLLLPFHATSAASNESTMVDVGGHELHLYCQGKGSSTLLLDAGLGGTHLDWSLVQPALAAFSRVCSYDRAGYGLSELGPTPRDAKNLARDVSALLQHPLLSSTPVVLVGHSLAGLHLRLVAEQNTDHVIGLTLIESAHEDQFEEFMQRAHLRLAPRHGDRIRLSPPAVPEQLKQADREKAQSYANNQKSLMTLRSELSHFIASAEHLQQSKPQLIQPLLVISRGQTQWKKNKDAELRESIWQELQLRLSELSDKSTHLIATESGHFVHLEQPDFVVEALASFTNSLQNSDTASPRQASLRSSQH